MDFVTEGAGLLAELQALRRELHRDPEIGLDLPRTQQRVLRALDGLGLEITTGQKTTSVVAVLRGGKPGPVVLLRGDMDGLPLTEQTGLDYASTTGTMHACGHDLHTAGLVGAARLLAAHREELPGTIIFMFQPGEEGYGGAKVMIEEGVLDAAGARPVAAYAIHVFSGPHGVFETRPRAMLAGSNNLTITVKGRGGHGSQPATAVDPVPPLAEIVIGLQTMVTRAFPTFDPVVVTTTMLQAGSAVNVIPDQARMIATVRTLSPESTERMGQQLPRRLADGIAAAHGCTADTEFETLYPVTWNDEAETSIASSVLRAQFGDDRVQQRRDPLMGSEDFAFVAQQVPSTLFMLSCSPKDADLSTVPFNHSPFVVFDDEVLGDQAAALAQLAWARVSRGA